ncbi:hypothetical protein ACOZDF_16690, partial [Streptomyces griseoincarnatus]
MPKGFFTTEFGWPSFANTVELRGGLGSAEGRRRPAARLLALTKPLDVPVGDQADGESEEGLVDVVASFP